MALALDRYPEFTYDGSPPEVSDLEDLRQLRKWEAAIAHTHTPYGTPWSANVHVKAPDAEAISDEAAKEVEASLFSGDNGWRMFQWLARDLVPDPSVVLG